MDGELVRVAGHLEEYRALGGIAFALLRDRSGTLQVTFKKGTTDPALFAQAAAIPRESVVEVTGTVQRSAKSQRGVEILPASLELVSESKVPLPLGVVDHVGVELDTRLNHRVIDLRKPAVRGVFELRAALLAGFRDAFRDREFLEVETPKLLRQGAEGGATLFPVQYFEERAYLAQSPQLYKQMLMGAGLERVFEIAPAFRAEPSDTVRHITEFTSLDAEMAYLDSAEELRGVLESIVREAVEHARGRLAPAQPELAARLPELTLPLPRITFAEVIRSLGRETMNVDLGTEEEKRLGERMASEHRSPFYFITDFPVAVKRTTFYARRSETDPSLTGYFDLYHRDLELASGGPREHRVDRLRAQISEAGLSPDEFPGYLEAFEYGMPPHGGWGFGVDRFVQALAGLPNIRETRLFPRDRYRLAP
ncbi:MAG: aspartate--tRNA(Asn) ligase [Thermoplasmata archaeon]|nr:aspartate--tRNA(Asn) ligase [Thermoplasmata archaeon]